MKRMSMILATGLLLPVLLSSFSPVGDKKTSSGTYIVVAWNDLGMHCANKDFSNMCILPPYNNQSAYVIQVGNSTTLPVIMPPSGSGIHVNYSVPGNTYSGSATNTAKTNFWVWSQHIFGVTLAPNIGLTGLGLSGAMADSGDFFHAQGIPLTPYLDNNLTSEDPFQLTLIQAYNASNQLLATTQSVIPVSNEINCISSGCHPNEMDILNEHEQVAGFNIANKPILCASCHADNALGMPGVSGTPPFSQAIHQKHGSKTNDCYKCHPGPNTQCYRDTMKTKGLSCQDCHGSVSNVGNTVAGGRQPWLQEPQCGATTCHGSNFAEEPGKLFRQSRGHGGLLCSTCHGSPHAIYTSQNPRDNQQNIALQGEAGILKHCEVCHGYVPAAPGPHGFNPLGIRPVSSGIPSHSGMAPNFPNPCSFMTNIPYSISSPGKATMSVYSQDGKEVSRLLDAFLQPGEYKAEFYAARLPAGIYYSVLTINGTSYTGRIAVAR